MEEEAYITYEKASDYNGIKIFEKKTKNANWKYEKILQNKNELNINTFDVVNNYLFTNVYITCYISTMPVYDMELHL